MSKSSDAKPSAHSTHAHGASALEKAVADCQQRAARLAPDVPDTYNPVESQVHGTAALDQLALAADDHTPRLFLVKGDAGLKWSALIGALLDRALVEANRPGAQSRPPEVPKDNRIDVAIVAAEAIRRRVVQAIEGNRLDTDAVDSLRLKILGSRKLVAGKARWDTELSSIITAIEGLGEGCPAALVELLSKLKAVAQQLAQARPQQAGRPRAAPIFSAAAIEAALALDVALGEFLSWAAATATDKRNAAIIRAIAPKRRSDAKSGGSGEGTGEGETTGSNPPAGSESTPASGVSSEAPTEKKP